MADDGRPHWIVQTMLVAFSTRNARLVMLGEPAVALLKLGGHSGTVPGAVLAADLPAFLARLRAGLELHGEEFSPAPPLVDPSNDDDAQDDRERPVRLRVRAVPLLEMLAAAAKTGSALMWERG